MQRQLELLRKYDISVKGVRGQHFLIDPNIQRKIVEFIDPQKTDTVVEIGAGLGALTEELAVSGATVFAIDSDVRFCAILDKEYKPHFPNLTVIHNDILKVDLNHLLHGAPHLKVVGNLPYYITSSVIFYLVQYRRIVQQAVLMVQKEIANRLLAQPGTKDYGRLTLAVRYFADVKRVMNVSSGCFTPKPKVESSVISLEFRKNESNTDETFLLALIKGAFAHRRKNVLNSLAGELKGKFPKAAIEKAFEKIGINPKKRAEELLLKDFLNLTDELPRQN